MNLLFLTLLRAGVQRVWLFLIKSTQESHPRCLDVALEEASDRRGRPDERDDAGGIIDEVCAWNSFHAQLANLPLAGELLFADIQQVVAGPADGSMICLLDVAARKKGRARVAVHAHDSASHRPQHAAAELSARVSTDWHVVEGDEDRVLYCAAQAGVIAYVVTDAQGDTAQGSQALIVRLRLVEQLDTIYFPNRDVPITDGAGFGPGRGSEALPIPPQAVDQTAQLILSLAELYPDPDLTRLAAQVKAQGRG